MKQNLLLITLLFPLSLFSMEVDPKDIIRPFLTGALISHEKKHPVINAFELSKKSFGDKPYFAQRLNTLPPELQDRISFLSSRERAKHCPKLEEIGQLLEDEEFPFVKIFKLNNRRLLGIQLTEYGKVGIQLTEYGKVCKSTNVFKLTRLKKKAYKDCSWIKTVEKEGEPEVIECCLIGFGSWLKDIKFFQEANILTFHYTNHTYLYKLKPEGPKLLQIFPRLEMLAISQDGSTLAHIEKTSIDGDEHEYLVYHRQQADHTYGEAIRPKISEGRMDPITYKKLKYFNNQLYTTCNDKHYKISFPNDSETEQTCIIEEIIPGSEKSATDKQATFHCTYLYSITVDHISYAIDLRNYLESICLGYSTTSFNLIDMAAKKNLRRLPNKFAKYFQFRDDLMWMDKDIFITKRGRIYLSTHICNHELYENYINKQYLKALARKLKSEYPETAPTPFESKGLELKEKIKCIDQVLIDAGHKHPKVAQFLAESPAWSFYLGGIGLQLKYGIRLLRQAPELTFCQSLILFFKGTRCFLGGGFLAGTYERYILPKLARYYR